MPSTPTDPAFRMMLSAVALSDEIPAHLRTEFLREIADQHLRASVLITRAAIAKAEAS